MNAKQAFEEAARYHLEKDRAHYAAGRFQASDAHCDSQVFFTARARVVEAEDAAWTAEARRLALAIRAGPVIDHIADARLLATLVLNAIGEKP